MASPRNLHFRPAFSSLVLIPRGAWGPMPSPAARARIFRRAAEMGFEGIELGPRWLDFHQLSELELRRLRGEIEEAGLVVSGLNLDRHLFTRGPRAEELAARVERSVAVAAALGAGLVGVALSLPRAPGETAQPLRGDDVGDEEWGRAVVGVRRLAERAAGAGLALSLELHDDGLLDTPERCLRMLEAVALPNVGLNPDLGNICRDPQRPGDWRRALALLGPHANNWHLKNYRDGRPIPLWSEDGEIDYREALTAMEDYRGWVSFESYFGDDVLGLQRETLTFWQRLTERNEGETPWSQAAKS